MVGQSASRTHHTALAAGSTLTICARYAMGSTHNSGNVIYRFYNLAIHAFLTCGGV